MILHILLIAFAVACFSAGVDTAEAGQYGLSLASFLVGLTLCAIVVVTWGDKK